MWHCFVFLSRSYPLILSFISVAYSASRLEGSWTALELFACKDTRVSYGDRIQ